MPDSINLLLSSLSKGDTAAIGPHLKSVYLEQQTVLYEVGTKIALVYFPTHAIISLVVCLSNGQTIEAAMVGVGGFLGAGEKDVAVSFNAIKPAKKK